MGRRGREHHHGDRACPAHGPPLPRRLDRGCGAGYADPRRAPRRARAGGVRPAPRRRVRPGMPALLRDVPGAVAGPRCGALRGRARAADPERAAAVAAGRARRGPAPAGRPPADRDDRGDRLDPGRRLRVDLVAELHAGAGAARDGAFPSPRRGGDDADDHGRGPRVARRRPHRSDRRHRAHLVPPPGRRGTFVRGAGPHHGPALRRRCRRRDGERPRARDAGGDGQAVAGDLPVRIALALAIAAAVPERLTVRAEVLGIGTELLLGQIENSNARWISERLAEVGVDVLRHEVVGDNLERITEAFERALARADVVIATGGLGPTQDDITREALADLFLGSTNPTVAFLAGGGEVKGRITAKAEDHDRARALIEPLVERALERLGDVVFSTEDEDLAHVVGRLLVERSRTIAAAESLTGGGLARRLSWAEGASAFFLGSAVCYSAQAK